MKLLYKIINLVDGKDCTNSPILRPSPDGIGVQELTPPDWDAQIAEDWVDDESHKVIFGYEHTDGRRFYDGDRVCGYIYDGLGPDYGDEHFTNAMVKYDTEEGEFIVFDDGNPVNHQFLGTLWDALANGSIDLVE